MKIFMIAPEPFFQPRGTPFSVFHRAKALSKFGHQVDLLTYHIGKNVDIPNVRIFRNKKVPFIKQIQIGPSAKKFFLDFLLFLKGFRVLKKEGYDCIHAHEEAGFWGIFYKKIFDLPLVYDMHSSIPEQITNFDFSESRMVLRFASWMERKIILNSNVVIGICPHLVETVHSIDSIRKTFVIENTPMVEDLKEVNEEEKKALAQELRLGVGKVLLYTGTFEGYQGLDLLIDSVPFVMERFPNTKYVLVGGEAHQVERLRESLKTKKLEGHVVLTGQRPFEDMAKFMAIADILVSPRQIGTNTPLKIYSYLKSGKPIVATNLLTHTQVLNDQVAVLTAPTAEAFATGILQLLDNPSRGVQLGKAGKEMMENDYSYEKFLEKTKHVYDYIMETRT